MSRLTVLSAAVAPLAVAATTTGTELVFKHLGYPPYLLPFLGTAKILGVLTVLVPEIPRLKEWAFAGLTFDVTGALYSHLSVGDPPGAWLLPVVALVLVGSAYVAYRTRRSGDQVFSSGEPTARTAAGFGLNV